ncbi:hypothetical protein Taro_023079, partial [Colocasia esculenta]|nr:hypothetical protein [Colocasia esculenta]
LASSPPPPPPGKPLTLFAPEHHHPLPNPNPRQEKTSIALSPESPLMAAAADPSAALSPRFRRSGRNHHSPWSQVVRGEPDPASPSSPSSPSPPAAAMSIAPSEAPDRFPPAAGEASEEPPAAGLEQPLPPPPSDGGDQGASAREKKSAWSRPSNGIAEAEPVMGAVSWPALSEATKASPKSSCSESLKALSDGSVFAPPAPVVSSPPPKQTANISNSNSSTNYGVPARQKPGKRGGGSGSGGTNAGKGVAALPNGRSAPTPTSAESSQNSLGKVMASEPAIRDLNNRGGSNLDHGSRGGGFPSQLQGGNEHQRSFGGNKRGNSGGGGPHHNLGNRRDPERGGGYDWNHRPFGGGRDVQMQQRPQHQPRPMVRPFIRPPPLVSPAFITPPSPRVGPFGNPMGYHGKSFILWVLDIFDDSLVATILMVCVHLPDIPSPLFYFPPAPPPESLGAMPFVAPPAMFFAAPDPQLQSVVAKQIEYYFSPENLCKDIYLRQNMDEEGWVPVSLIAGFNRVRFKYLFAIDYHLQ